MDRAELVSATAALRDNLKASRSDSTHIAYARAWAAFAAFAGSDEIPADPGQVGLYLSSLGQSAKPATVRLHAAAIAAAHKLRGVDSPTSHPGVAAVIAGHLRIQGAAQRQATGITADIFERISETAMNPRKTRGGRLEADEEARFRALVDVSLIGTMRDAMLRRSEAAALVWADITGAPDGTGRVTVRRSKTDQAGAGAILFLGDAVFECLTSLRTITSGLPGESVFHMSESQIARRIAAAAAHAGVEGRFSGHSPRIGMAQDLVAAGMSLPDLMVAGRWKSPAMPAHYTRGQEAGQGAVARYYSQAVH